MIDMTVSDLEHRQLDLRRVGWSYVATKSGRTMRNLWNTCPYPPYQPTAFYLDNFEPLDVVVIQRHPLDIWKEYAYMLKVLTEKEYVEWRNR